jgi:hypothetical protein
MSDGRTSTPSAFNRLSTVAPGVMFGVMIDAVVRGDSAAASDTPQFRVNGPEVVKRVCP